MHFSIQSRSPRQHVGSADCSIYTLAQFACANEWGEGAQAVNMYHGKKSLSAFGQAPIVPLAWNLGVLAV